MVQSDVFFGLISSIFAVAGFVLSGSAHSDRDFSSDLEYGGLWEICTRQNTTDDECNEIRMYFISISQTNFSL